MSASRRAPRSTASRRSAGRRGRRAVGEGGKPLPPPKPPQPPRPVLVFTVDGKPVKRIFAPKGANDVRIVFGFGILGGFGWWTRNGKAMKDGGFFVPPFTNDFHFSLTGKFAPGAKPLVPPPGANDIEIVWEGDAIREAYWTRYGERMEPIPLEGGTKRIDFDVPPGQG